MVTTSVRNTKWLKITNLARLYYPHFTTFRNEIWNITNFVMLFHAIMEFCLDLLRSKFWLILLFLDKIVMFLWVEGFL
jgi:hypothetical protein